MIQDIPWQLLEKHFAKSTSQPEESQVIEWIEKAPENAMIYTQLQAHYQQTGSLPVEFVPDTHAAIHKVNARLNEKKVFKLSPVWYAAAASIILMVGYFGIFKPNFHQQSKSLLTISSTDSTTTAVLADGTRVWLNAGSTMVFPTKFASTREVRLTGEGYFEVAHDPEHPFVVQTGVNIVKVLGTKFDIRSYPLESFASVTVSEGKVSFGTVQNQPVFLTSGKKGTYNKQSEKILETANDNPNFMAWKTKEFTFDAQSLESVFKALAEVYHIKYRFLEAGIKGRKLTAKFTQRPLKEIIQSIAIATNTNIKSENNIVLIQ